MILKFSTNQIITMQEYLEYDYPELLEQLKCANKELINLQVKAIEYATKNKGAEIFNLGTGTGYSVLDIVKAFEKANDITIPYAIKPRRDGDVAECYADPVKAKEKLCWQAEKTLEDMCKDSWRWQSNNPDGYSE
jgi:UDP-glucose 4-epimerase